MPYRINGNECTLSNGLLPSSHSIPAIERTRRKTVGGIVVIEPPEGTRRAHVWHYEPGRPTAALYYLRQYLDLASSPIVVIDTYDVVQNPDGTFPLLTDLVCTVDFPEIKTANQRNLSEAFTITFTEIAPQS